MSINANLTLSLINSFHDISYANTWFTYDNEVITSDLALQASALVIGNTTISVCLWWVEGPPFLLGTQRRKRFRALGQESLIAYSWLWLLWHFTPKCTTVFPPPAGLTETVSAVGDSIHLIWSSCLFNAYNIFNSSPSLIRSLLPSSLLYPILLTSLMLVLLHHFISIHIQ